MREDFALASLDKTSQLSIILLASMTRYTNLGRKRSYVDAGINYRENASSQNASGSTASPAEAPTSEGSEAVPTYSGTFEPPKKKRRRGKASNEKREAKRAAEGETGKDSREGTEEGAVAASEALVEGGEKPESNKAKKLREYKEKQKVKRKKGTGR